jgi:hypothetical protein
LFIEFALPAFPCVCFFEAGILLVFLLLAFAEIVGERDTFLSAAVQDIKSEINITIAARNPRVFIRFVFCQNSKTLNRQVTKKLTSGKSERFMGLIRENTTS